MLYCLCVNSGSGPLNITSDEGGKGLTGMTREAGQVAPLSSVSPSFWVFFFSSISRIHIQAHCENSCIRCFTVSRR